jgi:hypothetical protein
MNVINQGLTYPSVLDVMLLSPCMRGYLIQSRKSCACGKRCAELQSLQPVNYAGRWSGAHAMKTHTGFVSEIECLQGCQCLLVQFTGAHMMPHARCLNERAVTAHTARIMIQHPTMIWRGEVPTIHCHSCMAWASTVYMHNNSVFPSHGFPDKRTCLRRALTSLFHWRLGQLQSAHRLASMAIRR